MLSFFKPKKYPIFWTTYRDITKNYHPKNLKETKFVVFDCETTGLDINTDRVLSIGAVTLENNQIKINNILELYIEQDYFNKESVTIHGILKKGTTKQISEEEAVKIFLKHIQGAILIGHHVMFDIQCVNKILQRLALPKLLNKYLDTSVLYNLTKIEIYKKEFQNYSLDELCNLLNITKKDRHTATGDAYLTALVFLKIIGKLNKITTTSLNDLFNAHKVY